MQFWETSDTYPKASKRTYTGAWPLEPRATVANTLERDIKLPPARYWAIATRDGKQIDARLLTVGWGGREEVIIGDTETPKDVGIQSSADDGRSVAGSDEYQRARILGGSITATILLVLLFLYLVRKARRAQRAAQNAVDATQARPTTQPRSGQWATWPSAIRI